jgi:hypothetical protein
MTTSTGLAHRPARRRLAYLARRALQMEIAVWRSLYRFVFRRPRVPRGATAFSYHEPVSQVLIVFIVLSAIEIPVIDLVVHRWAYIRIPILIAGIWGLTWMVGLLLGFVTRPHAVGPQGIRVRYGAEVEVALSWSDIRSISMKKKVAEPRTPQVTTDDEGATLHLRMQHETNLEIELDHPIDVRLPRGRSTVDRLRIYADQPRQLLAEARAHLGTA